ncbi:hypothetical protein [Allohahella marinimesophila]|uniref:Uncharacterized protein n=1 Tax=Allohahella marinimesophila TaxID=1054972 RepID=A0ABP7NXT2_9GAMM
MALSPFMAEASNLCVSEQRRLARDIPVLHLYDPQSTCILSVMLAHLKSGYDPQGFDPGGQKRRAAEASEEYSALGGACWQADYTLSDPATRSRCAP